MKLTTDFFNEVHKKVGILHSCLSMPCHECYRRLVDGRARNGSARQGQRAKFERLFRPGLDAAAVRKGQAGSHICC